MCLNNCIGIELKVYRLYNFTFTKKQLHTIGFVKYEQLKASLVEFELLVNFCWSICTNCNKQHHERTLYYGPDVQSSLHNLFQMSWTGSWLLSHDAAIYDLWRLKFMVNSFNWYIRWIMIASIWCEPARAGLGVVIRDWKRNCSGLEA